MCIDQGPVQSSSTGSRSLKSDVSQPSSGVVKRNTDTNNAGEDEECQICLEMGPLSTLPCNHGILMCSTCKARCRNVCPICQTPFGNQPARGRMTHQVIKSSLPGHRGNPTIKITYHIPSGIQTHDHPNPGKPYTEITRDAYLPDSRKGQVALKLLQKAFDAGLTFTLGKSIMTGMDNCVIWNDIHHKTNMAGGPEW